MKIERRAVLWLSAIAVGLALQASSGSAAEAGAELTAKDEDAFVLYEYSALDARKKSSPRITESTEGDTAVYRYDGHALSCRTVMTGSITRTTRHDKTHLVGDFDVNNNSYGIEQLSFDFHDEGEENRTGTMTVDGKVIDITSFDHR